MATPLAEREWLRPKEAAEYLGISLSTLYNWRRKGIVRFYRMGPRAVGLRRGELESTAGSSRPESPKVLSAETVRRITEHSEEMRRRYGILPSSTPFIRAERNRHTV